MAAGQSTGSAPVSQAGSSLFRSAFGQDAAVSDASVMELTELHILVRRLKKALNGAYRLRAGALAQRGDAPAPACGEASQPCRSDASSSPPLSPAAQNRGITSGPTGKTGHEPGEYRTYYLSESHALWEQYVLAQHDVRTIAELLDTAAHILSGFSGLLSVARVDAPLEDALRSMGQVLNQALEVVLCAEELLNNRKLVAP